MELGEQALPQPPHTLQKHNPISTNLIKYKNQNSPKRLTTKPTEN